jgi:proteasome lid subunit RPN8/RPN11
MRVQVAGVVVMVVLFSVRGECSPSLEMHMDARELACEGAVLAQAWQLLESAQFGRSRREHAAFIVRRADGAHELERWPYEAESHRASYEGSLPAGTVAIIHTHPNELELPSEGDRRLASRSGLPVYVVTRTRISKTARGEVETIWSGNWDPRFAGRSARSKCGEGRVVMKVASVSGTR